MKAIASLFEGGQSLLVYPLKIVWKISENELSYPAQTAFSVSSKIFRKSIDRNLLKRRMREAYRKNKQILYEHLSANNNKLVFVIILRGTVVPDYLTIEKSIKDVIRRLIELSQKTEDRRPETEDLRLS